MKPIKIIIITTLTTCTLIIRPWKDCILSIDPIHAYSQVGRATCGDDSHLMCQCSDDALAAEVVSVGCLKAIKNLKLDIETLFKKINAAVVD